MTKLYYKCNDNITHEIKGLTLTENSGKYWIWSETLEHNLVYKSPTYENALLASIASLLHTIELKNETIADLQIVADLAYSFADKIKPDADYRY